MSGMARRVPFVSLVAFAVLTVGCGVSEGGDVEVRAYAKAVCSGLLTWRQGVSADSTALSTPLHARASEVATVKGRYSQFFAGTVRRTEELVRTVEKAGAPKVDNGLGYARDLLAALGRTRSGFTEAQTRFARLPIGDLRSYAAGAANIRDWLGTLFTEVGAALDRLGTTYTDTDLSEAFRDEPDCRSLA
jgi:hypothetical protein